MYVYNVQPGSVADGVINVGDRILQANEIDLTECSPEHASTVISVRLHSCICTGLFVIYCTCVCVCVSGCVYMCGPKSLAFG